MLDTIARRAMQSHVKASLKKIPKGVKVRTLNTVGVSNAAQRLKDAPVTFNVNKVSDTYSQFLNKPARRGDDKIYPKEAGAKYLAEAKAYWRKNKTFKGFKRYIDPETGVATHRIKDGSVFLKSGDRAAKPKRLDADAIERAQRELNEAEQTFGPSGRDKLVHHRTELSFIEAIARGLNPTQRRKFYEYVHYNDRWSNLKLGNEDVNLIGSVDDPEFHHVHVDAHKLLKMAGLNPHTTDFTGATLEQRYGFLDEVSPLLQQIDEFVYSQRMAGKYPTLRHTSGPKKGQLMFKRYKRPPKSSK